MLKLARAGDYWAFDRNQCVAAGRALANEYRSASPFPHIVIDDFLNPEVLRAILAEFPDASRKGYFDRDQERLKYQFEPSETSSGLVRNLFAELNGDAFLLFLEELTGIEGLVSDPYFVGGGLHETKRGGHLGVHADFNIHGKIKLERKLNLLIYLNEDWLPDYGGELELWDQQMTSCRKKVAPLFGRAVIFTTALDSYHGHPDPLTCPPERSRRSLATYYYSLPENGLVGVPIRNTKFQPRPGTGDRPDWAIKRLHFINDWVPPKLQRYAFRLFG